MTRDSNDQGASGRAIGLLAPAWPGRLRPNGIVTAVHNLALGLIATGHRPVILTTHVDSEVSPDIAGIPVIRIDPTRSSLLDRLRRRLGDRDTNQRAFADALAQAVRQAVAVHGLDALLMEETHGWAGMVQGRVTIPVVAVLHGPWFMHRSLQPGRDPADDDARERREAASLKRVAGILSPSADVLRATQATVPLPPATPAQVIPNALSIRDSSMDPDTGEIGGDRRILFVGRFDRHKGGDTVLEAWNRLATRCPDASLTFVGPDRGIARPGTSRLRLEQALDRLEPQARLRLEVAGPLERMAIDRLRGIHGIALIGSRYENLNYTMLEAMAAGQAIVCTAVGGPAEILTDGETALLVPPENPEAMAEALERLLDDPVLSRRLGTAARALLARDFDPAIVAERTVVFVEALLPA